MYYRLFVYSTYEGDKIQGLLVPMHDEALLNRAIDILLSDILVAEAGKLLSTLTINVSDDYRLFNGVYPVNFEFLEDNLINRIYLYRHYPNRSFSYIPDNRLTSFDNDEFVIASSSDVMFEKY